MESTMYFRVLLLLAAVDVVLCFQLIPERAKVLSVHDKYAENVIFTVKRYGRKSAYYVNLEYNLLKSWTNNVSVHFVAYEFLHNEYRRSFVELHYKFCDFLTNDPFLSYTLTKVYGLRCPMPVGQYKLMNVSIPTEDFPNVFPFEKGRVHATFEQNETGDIIATGYLDALFKNVRVKKAKGKQ